jgi:predicted nucleic acid-binding protein
MTRFVVDASAILHIVGEGIEVSPTHELLAPTLLRSQALSALHEAAHHGTMPVDVARDRLTRLWRMKIRYLGDAVLRRVAWEVADQLHLPSTYDAEYVALTRLQADALVTRNTDLARTAEALVTLAPIEALVSGSASHEVGATMRARPAGGRTSQRDGGS